jgi:hypothetical protein
MPLVTADDAPTVGRRGLKVFHNEGEAMPPLESGYYNAVVERVWPRTGTHGDYWEWTFTVGNSRVKGFTSASLYSEKTRKYLAAVLNRAVDPEEEFYPSSLGGERCTLRVGTVHKLGRLFNSVEDVI